MEEGAGTEDTVELEEWRRRYDWKSLSDAEIGRLAGVSRARAGQVREALGLPRSARWHRMSGTVAERLAAIPDGESRGMTAKDLGARVGCGEAYCRRLLAGMGKPFEEVPAARKPVFSKYAWGSLSREDYLELSDKEIARRLGVRNLAVVQQWRRRQGLVKKVRQEGAACPREAAAASGG